MILVPKGKLERIRQFSHRDTPSRNLTCFLFFLNKVLSLAVSQPKNSVYSYIITSWPRQNLLLTKHHILDANFIRNRFYMVPCSTTWEEVKIQLNKFNFLLFTILKWNTFQQYKLLKWFQSVDRQMHYAIYFWFHWICCINWHRTLKHHVSTKNLHPTFIVHYLLFLEKTCM